MVGLYSRRRGWGEKAGSIPGRQKSALLEGRGKEETGDRRPLDDTPLLEGPRWPPPSCQGNRRLVTAVARGGGGGSRSEQGPQTLRSEE